MPIVRPPGIETPRQRDTKPGQPKVCMLAHQDTGQLAGTRDTWDYSGTAELSTNLPLNPPVAMTKALSPTAPTVRLYALRNTEPQQTPEFQPFRTPPRRVTPAVCRSPSSQMLRFHQVLHQSVRPKHCVSRKHYPAKTGFQAISGLNNNS